MATAALSKPEGGIGRITSVDVLRGLIMAIMAIDHTRDYFTNLRFEPENLAHTYYALFFTRWITHFCAPLFFFLAGTGAFFYGQRRSPAQLSRFLLTRGLWLILLEFTVVWTGWSFQLPWGFFGVIWALGASMVILAALVRMPVKWLAAVCLLVIATHDLLDPIRPKQFGDYGWIWGILHVRTFVFLPFGVGKFVLFQIVPWFAVMGAGYAFGTLFKLAPEERRKWMTRIGLAAVALFILLRTTNLYGNPPAGLGGVSQGDWHVQPTIEKTIILFLDVEKYPPSLQFLLMTIGPAILLLSWLDRREGFRPLVVIGRVPLFFYILHIYLIHTMAVVVALARGQSATWLTHGGFFNGYPDDYGYGLPFIYLMWAIAIAILYFPCRWWAELKRTRKDWWLSYL